MTRARYILCVTLPIILIGGGTASAELTSRNAVELARLLSESPETDKNKDGVLSFDEFDQFFRTQGDKKKKANPLLMELTSGDLLITSFEENNLGKMGPWGWKIEGDAFLGNADTGTRLMKRRSGAFGGRFFLTSYSSSGGDGATGRMLSPEFEIKKPFINFLLSGGEFAGATCMNLIIGERVLRTATGRNDDRFERFTFAVADMLGKRAQIEIVDTYRNVWGRISVDEITQSDQAWAKEGWLIDAPSKAKEVKSGFMVCADGYSPTGMAVMRDGKLDIGGRAIPHEDILLVVRDPELPKNHTPKSVLLKSGETWQANRILFEDGKFIIHSPQFGSKEIAIEQVASFDLGTGMPASGAEVGNLYRSDGQPIRGRLIWVREKDVAIDCALGIVPVPIANVGGYVFADPIAGSAKTDEVWLSDGSLLFGNVSFDGDRLAIEHPVLGALKIPWSSVKALRRADERIVWLDQVEPEIVESSGPVSAPPAPQVSEAEDADHFRTIRMMPRSVVGYGIPVGSAEMAWTLTGELQVIPGARVPATVRVSVGDNVLFEREVGPGEDSQRIDVSLPETGRESETILVSVEFAGRFAFPCGVEWRDLRVQGIEKEVRN